MDVRLAELLGSLSLGTDLGMGQPMEHVLNQSLIALRLARAAGLDAPEQQVVFYTSLLAWVGCHVDAYEQAKWFGDEQALKADFRRVDPTSAAAQALFILRHAGTGQTLARRAGTGIGVVRGAGISAATAMLRNHWRAADDLAERLGLGAAVRRSIEQTFERWDGRGVPVGVTGDDIRLTAQIVNLADVVEIYHRTGGPGAAFEVARRRSGTQFSPDLVDLLCQMGADLFRQRGRADAWTALLTAEPEPRIRLSDAQVVAALEAIADFVDLKSPYTLGHSRAVADLAGAAAGRYGLDATATESIRRAGLVHDLGRLGVPHSIWDAPGDLTMVEIERVRMHPYLTERMLSVSAALAPLGAIAVQHHERLDGSGYPRGLRGDELGGPGRILAAADCYRAWPEPRPHRPAGSRDEVAARLRGEARAGRLDAAAVHSVLQAAGHPGHRRRDWPAGLTTREVQVLRMLARGCSNRQIAEELVISPKTVGNHVEHIYLKIGVTNRSLAGLFASTHGMIIEGGERPKRG